jgi:hypothetical protein
VMFALTVPRRKLSGEQMEELAGRLLGSDWLKGDLEDGFMTSEGTSWACLLERTEDGEGAVLSVEAGGSIVVGTLGLWNRGLAPELRRKCMDLQDEKVRVETDAAVAKIMEGIG